MSDTDEATQFAAEAMWAAVLAMGVRESDGVSRVRISLDFEDGASVTGYVTLDGSVTLYRGVDPSNERTGA